MKNSTRVKVMQELISGMPQGGLIPALRFFVPKPAFLDWMRAEYAGRRMVYDVGAGCGHVSRQLSAEGIKMEAFDISCRDECEFPVELGNAVDYLYQPDSVVMFCRPCHGPFVEAAIARGLECGVSAFLYISVPRNGKDDLGHFDRKFKRVLRKAGKEDEQVYRWE